MRHGELPVDVSNYHDVEAVVLEITGDVSVVHGGSDFNDDLLADVRQ